MTSPPRIHEAGAALAGALVVLLAMLGAMALMRRTVPPHAGPEVPERFATDLPPACRQVMLVVSPEPSAITAELWLMERSTAADAWKVRRGPLPVTLGRSGLAWGTGEHRSEAPEGFPIKVEGDGCSPAGIFRIPFAFGMAPQEEAARLKLPYTFLTPDIFGVEDPDSRYYNQVVDITKVTPDWSAEEHDPMSRRPLLYRWGAFVANNPKCIPGAGSCIFLHRWPGPGEPTAGCTGMAEEDLGEVLAWLDPALEPRLIQTTAGLGGGLSVE